MSCSLPENIINDAVKFHGHRCPGLMIGIRASEIALREFPDTVAPDLMAVVETDSCGVDAIQSILSCTYGKGNLIHRDLGKMAFSFFDRTGNKGIRVVLKSDAKGETGEGLWALMKKMSEGSADDNERSQIAELRKKIEDRYFSLPIEEMFDIYNLKQIPPRHARILDSLKCENCGEMTMESRTRRLMGKTLCISCFDKLDSNI